MVSMSMSGVPYMHSDLGGFTGGEKQPELYARWLQFGAFGPLMRAHGSGGIPPEPIYYDEPIKSIVRDYIKLRYRLSPYLYTLAHKNTQEGLPIALPMNFFDHKNRSLTDVNDQYFFGEDMLIAPVTEQGKTSREVLLPAGQWVDYWTGRVYQGNRTISVAAPLETLPIFIKGGAILPTISDRASLSTYATDSLVLQYYLAGEGSSQFSLYDDNGKTTDMSQSELLNLTASNRNGKLMLALEKNGNSFEGAPQQRYIVWQIRGMQSKPQQVMWGSNNLQEAASAEALGAGKMYYDADEKTLWLAGNYSAGRSEVTVSYTPIKDNGQSMNLQIVAPETVTGEAVNLGFIAPEAGNYTLEVRDKEGRTVFLKAFMNAAAGLHSANWSGTDSRLKKLEPGAYNLVLTTKNSVERKNIKLK